MPGRWERTLATAGAVVRGVDLARDPAVLRLSLQVQDGRWLDGGDPQGRRRRPQAGAHPGPEARRGTHPAEPGGQRQHQQWMAGGGGVPEAIACLPPRRAGTPCSVPTRRGNCLAVARTERFQRGETWALGRCYAALAVSYEVLAILMAGMSTILNAADPSALVGPSLDWSVADNVDVVAGGFTAFGERPDAAGGTLRPRSEFGLYPASGYVQLKAYF